MKEKTKTKTRATKNKKSTKSIPLKILINEKNKVIKELNKEIELLKDKNIKLLAEFDNFQRRSFDEKEASRKYQGLDIVKDLLPAFDDINRALEYEDADNESIFKATQLIHSKIEKILEKYSIIKIKSLEEDFDPTLHEALLEQESDSVEKGKIIEEYESGYKYHDKIIRHAKVVVSKGKP